MRRKVIALIVCGIMMFSTVGLTACGEPSKAFIGEWTANDSSWGEVSLELAEDNTAEFVIFDIESKGTWAYDEESEAVTVTTDQFTDFEVAKENGSLSFEFGDSKIKLDKVKE